MFGLRGVDDRNNILLGNFKTAWSISLAGEFPSLLKIIPIFFKRSIVSLAGCKALQYA